MSQPAPERVVSSRDVFRGRLIRVRVDEVSLPNGRMATREIVDHPGAVVIVAPDDQGRVAMVRQYRAAVQKILLELPAGTREPNESPEECARRELFEEMGLTAASWAPLLGFYSSPGFCTEYLWVFLATGLSAGTGQPMEDEVVEREWVALDQVPALIASGQICDAKSIASLLFYLQQHGVGGRVPWRS